MAAALLAKRWWGKTPTTNAVGVELYFYRPRKTGDIDGPIKASLDCLNGAVWVDDKQVVELHVYRMDDKLSPRAEVRVWER